MELDEGEEVEKARALWATTVTMDTLDLDRLYDLKVTFGIEVSHKIVICQNNIEYEMVVVSNILK